MQLLDINGKLKTLKMCMDSKILIVLAKNPNDIYYSSAIWGLIGLLGVWG